MNICNDPIETFEYLLSFNPPSVDFRLPLNHHASHTYRGNENAEYGKWYAQILDYILHHKLDARVRFLSGLVHSLSEQPAADRFFGNKEMGVLVVETNGDYELVDNLKVIGEGLTKTGMNVRDNSLEEFVEFRASWLREKRLDAVPLECTKCELQKYCRSGYYIHRYSQRNGFCNPNIYCDDMKFILPYTYQRLSE